jgi:replication factor A1
MIFIRWKIRGIVSFKYDIRRFNNEHGDGEIFVFDIKDRSGEITITSFNLCARSLEPRIEKNSVRFHC